jgi:hypothetical protein
LRPTLTSAKKPLCKPCFLIEQRIAAKRRRMKGAL